MAMTAASAVYLQENVNAAVRNPFMPQLPLPKEPNKEDLDKKGAVKPADKPLPGPVTLEEKNLPSLKVTGLVWNSKRPQAIINGQVVGVGETIGEVKIVSIRPDGVDVLYQDKIITITP